MIADLKPSDKALSDGIDSSFFDGYHFAIQMDSTEHAMTEATLLIKKMPPELKHWLAGEAERNHRSMNKEAIRLLEEARILRDKALKPVRDARALASILQTMRALPVLDARPMNEVLYDASGIPK